MTYHLQRIWEKIKISLHPLLINSNGDNLTKINKNKSFSQKYELELQNTNEDKSEKIEVEIKCPIRQGLRKNFKRNSVRNKN